MSASIGFCSLCRCGLGMVRSTVRQDVWSSNISQKRYKSYRKFQIETKTANSLYLEVGHMAKFADGAVVARYGNTSVLVTAVSGKSEVPQTASFLPLTVDYRQKAAAAGRIPTNHLRREMGPTEKEILTGRVIDRSLRSMFPAGYFQETQITCNLLSVDGVNDPDIVSINAASAALMMSDIPWGGPVGAVRVGYTEDGRFLINPTRLEQQTSLLNLVITADAQEQVVMLEGEGNNVPYTTFQAGVEVGASHAALIANNIAAVNSDPIPKRSYKPQLQVPDSLLTAVESIGAASINDILHDTSHDKISRDKALQAARYKIVSTLQAESSEDQKLLLHEAVSQVIKKLFREQIINDEIRCDGRNFSQVRPITASVGLFEPLHGSALFQRGQTQVLCTVTFDSLQAAMKMDQMSVLTGALKEKNFMLHYEFPSYATNELKLPGTRSRRELGHGALAEKGLRAVIPDKFPFSIRLTSEVLESNGSSSMASICGGSLALMDAGVPISEPAAGVAIGLITRDPAGQLDPNRHDSYSLLIDILGIEDYMGDMDFKVGGTQSGVTAVQMDLKIPGIPVAVINMAMDRARGKLGKIINYMTNSCSINNRSSESVKSNRPIIEKLTVLPAKRAAFVGVGGVHLKKLQSETGVTVSNIDESTYEIFAPNSDAMAEAQEMIKMWLETKKEPVLEFNAIYEAKIVEIRSSGVMVQIHPAMDPTFLHNSQLDHRQVSHPSALGFEEGQTISIKYFGRDPASGQIRISRKVITAPSSRTFRFMEDN